MDEAKRKNWFEWALGTFVVPLLPLVVAALIRSAANKLWWEPLFWNYEVPFSAIILFASFIGKLHRYEGNWIALLRAGCWVFAILMGLAMAGYYADEASLFDMRIPPTFKHRAGVTAFWTFIGYAVIATLVEIHERAGAKAVRTEVARWDAAQWDRSKWGS